MRRWTWRKTLGVVLVLSSVALFAVHFAIFRDFHHIAIYTLGDIAFLPLEVLIVTLVIHELLEARSRAERVNKLNMVIGAFYSEVGNDLLRSLIEHDEFPDDVRSMAPATDWDDTSFARAMAALPKVTFRMRLTAEDLRSLRDFLVLRRDFMLRLLENPNLLEHESFSDVLWAVFHLAEELESRDDIEALPASDIAHLAGDAERAYRALLGEWLGHARHLRAAYPYLYSLLVRTNPLRVEPAPEVTA